MIPSFGRMSVASWVRHCTQVQSSFIQLHFHCRGGREVLWCRPDSTGKEFFHSLVISANAVVPSPDSQTLAREQHGDRITSPSTPSVCVPLLASLQHFLRSTHMPVCTLAQISVVEDDRLTLPVPAVILLQMMDVVAARIHSPESTPLSRAT